MSLSSATAPAAATTLLQASAAMELPRHPVRVAAANREDARTDPGPIGCRIRFEGMEVAYTDLGSDTPVVLIHGSVGSRRQWDPIAGRLASRFRVLAPDLIGYGDSSPLPPRPHALATEIAVVRAMSVVAGQRLHLVGHSYGGLVALAAAAELDERIASLTLVEPAIFPLLRTMDEHAAWSEVQAWSARHFDLWSAGRRADCARNFIAYWLGAQRWQVMNERARSEVTAQMPRLTAEWELTRALAIDAARLARVCAPTLVLGGARTPYVARRVQACLAHALPDVAQHVVAEAGHLLPLSHPGAVADAIEAHVTAAMAPA